MDVFASRPVRHLLYIPQTQWLHCIALGMLGTQMGGAHDKGSGTGLLAMGWGGSQLCIFPLRGLTEGSLVWKISSIIIKHSPRATKPFLIVSGI